MRLALAVVLVPLTVSCGTTADSDEVTVFAASSLREVLGRMDPGVPVRFSFAGSSDLATQLNHGARADVFASADNATMRRVSGGVGIARPAQEFATNTLVLVTAPGNPHHITGLADLTKQGLTMVVCAPQVPCGAAARTMAEHAGVTLRPVSEESSVTDVLGKVVSGQADIGVVYTTTVAGHENPTARGAKVTAVPLPEAAMVRNHYPVAVLKNARRPAKARRFVDYLLSPAGQKVLAEAGFGAP